MAELNHLKKMGLFLFVREFFQYPAVMGAAFPSSISLAKKVSSQIPRNQAGYILELGAGTGVVTDFLLQSGISPDQFIAVERSDTFCEHLKKRCPRANIIHGDAVNLSGLLGEKTGKIATIISGLPLRSLPSETAAAIGKQFEKVLMPGGTFIQYTYSWLKTHSSLPKSFKYSHSKHVYFNLPPARVDVYKHEKL